MKKYEMSYDLDYKGQSFSRETRFNFKSKKYKASFHIVTLSLNSQDQDSICNKNIFFSIQPMKAKGSNQNLKKYCQSSMRNSLFQSPKAKSKNKAPANTTLVTLILISS